LRGIFSAGRMQLLEHEAKRRARALGLAVPKGYIAMSAEAAAMAAFDLGDTVVVKAQVPTGGRSKGGGVFVTSTHEVEAIAQGLLGSLVCGYPVNSVLVEEYVPSDREIYMAIAIDPRRGSAVLMLGLQGGVDVNRHAEKVARVDISVLTGLRDWHVWQAAEACEADAETTNALIYPAKVSYELFTRHRADLVEINPLLMTKGSQALAADIRIVVPGPDEANDGNLSRTRDGFDLMELDPQGLVGLLTTGAGASMLLVDVLTEAGLRPINFCDIRTGGLRGSSARLVAALRQLERYPNLACIAVNVFAGITDLAEFTKLLLSAIDECSPSVPVIVRVEGLGAEIARKRIRESGLISARSFDELEKLIHDTVNHGSRGEMFTC